MGVTGARSVDWRGKWREQLAKLTDRRQKMYCYTVNAVARKGSTPTAVGSLDSSLEHEPKIADPVLAAPQDMPVLCSYTQIMDRS